MKNSLLFLLLIVLSGLHGCRVVPVQMARVSLTERFSQGFFDKPGGVSNSEMTRTVQELLGPKNYEALLRKAPERVDQLKNQGCESRGFANFGLAVVPGSIRSKQDFDFFVTGNGSYSIVLKRDDAVFYTSAFQLVEEIHSAAELRNGLLKVHFRQQLIGHYASDPKNFTNESVVEVQVRLKTIESGVYSLDYQVPHEIQVNSRFVGYLRFELPVLPKAKLIDLRGLKYVRNKY